MIDIRQLYFCKNETEISNRFKQLNEIIKENDSGKLERNRYWKVQ